MMSALVRLSRPACWLLVCLLGFGLAGAGWVIAVRTAVDIDHPAEQVSSPSPPAPVLAARPAPHAGLSPVRVDAPDVGDSWIAFSAVDEARVPGLYLVAPDGSVVRRIVTGEAAQLHRAWSRDGRSIVFCGTVGDQMAPASECVEELNLPSNGLPLARGASYFDTRPVPSPDGRKVAFVRVHKGTPATASVLVRDLGTGRTSTIVSPRANAGLAFDWAPDGLALVYSAAPGWTVENLWISSVDGRHRRQLTALPSSQEASSPTFSPDGEWIVFRLLGDGDPTLMRIHPNGTGLSLVAKLDTGAPTELDWGPALRPRPSPGWDMRPSGMTRLR